MNRKATEPEIEEHKAALKELVTLFPTLPQAEAPDWLIEVTAFPFAPLASCMPRLRVLAKETHGNWKKVLADVYEDMENGSDDRQLPGSSTPELTQDLNG